MCTVVSRSGHENLGYFLMTFDDVKKDLHDNCRFPSTCTNVSEHIHLESHWKGYQADPR